MFVENRRLYVGFLDNRIDDGELDLGKLVGDFFQSRFLAEPDSHDRAVSLAREPTQGLLTLCVVLRFEIAVIRARILLELFSAHMDAFVEGFVELAPEVVHDRGLESVLRENGGGGEGEARECEAESGSFHRQFSLSGPDCNPVAWGRWHGKAHRAKHPRLSAHDISSGRRLIACTMRIKSPDASQPG